jgi:hypothetical protein
LKMKKFVFYGYCVRLSERQKEKFSKKVRMCDERKREKELVYRRRGRVKKKERENERIKKKT